MSNRLKDAQSPYLLQHKDNPVDWWPWSDEAFDAARKQDKPVFLSIGYSTCHWCHVMERESFEDEAVARLMNEAFINIKVDREERPDIDNVYMTVCQVMTGHGGWPLTLLLTPEKKPFFAATYIPKHTRHGRLGLLDLIPRIQAAWQQRREDVVDTAERVAGLLEQTASQPATGPGLDPDALHLAYAQLRQRFDARNGGFGSAPKFPSPHNLLFLLRYWKRTGEALALEMVKTTLSHMRRGGIYDHVGYGFHRYSTDAEWKLPHFEKMLYDQAMLALAYTEAFQATRDTDYEQTAREIFQYVLRDMTAPEGGFYSAEDADSEGREGKFYVWTVDELREALDESLLSLAMAVYNVDPEGNFEEEATRRRTGENVLFRSKSLAELAAERGLQQADLEEELAKVREQLFAHREQRVRPGMDDKILVDWNGLMIAALARAARVLGERSYAEAAQRAADFIVSTLRTDEDRLLHRYRNGDAAMQATLDDYTFFIWGLLELYETIFDPALLETALVLNEQLIEHYWDDEHGAFFFTPDDGERVLVRQKEAYDGAIPSGNSIAMLNLLRLGRMTGNTEYEQKADALGKYFAAAVRQQPVGFTAMLMALDFAVGPSYEVVVAGEPEREDTLDMLSALASVYVPNKVVLLRPEKEEEPRISRLAPFTATQRSLDSAATAYVCRNFQCERHTTDPEAMLALLGKS